MVLLWSHRCRYLWWLSPFPPTSCLLYWISITRAASYEQSWCQWHPMLLSSVPVGSPSRGGDVALYVFDMINQPSLPTPFYSVHVSISVFMALSTVFRSINSPGNSLLSHSVLLVLFLPYWSFQLSISLWKFPSALMLSFVVDWA